MDMESPESTAMVQPDGTIQQASHIRQVDGEKGQIVAPMPIAGMGAAGNSIPTAMMMGAPGAFGQPAYNPVLGPNSVADSYGMPITPTPLGMPGPPHLPFGGQAGLKSHTMRNRTKQYIPGPAQHVLYDVKAKPGIRIPDPVTHVQYEESQPIFRQP
jgi:hypothetical protein